MERITDAVSALSGLFCGTPPSSQHLAPLGRESRSGNESKMGHAGVEQIRKAARQAQEIAQAFDRSLRFEVREEAGLVQVSVVDTVTDSVVRKIPPDYIVHFMAHVREMFGAMLDTEA